MDESEQHNVSESSESTVAVDEQPAAAPEAEHDAGPRGFLSELTNAMRGAAERERERVSAEVDAATEAHVEKVRARAATEAAELRRLAEDDIDGIHAWSKEETIRIRDETELRIGTRREELQGYLIRHAAIIDGEVGHVEGAVRDYRTELDQFFARLVAETDPAAFARMADEMPEPPDLGKVGSAARAEAVAALAEEQDAADAGVADAVASAEVSGQQAAAASTAFNPMQPGPELVPVMNQASEMANGSTVMADVVASGEATATSAEAASDAADASTEAGTTSGEAAAEATEAAGESTEQPNAAVRILRSIASSLAPSSEHPNEAVAETVPAGATADEDEPKA